MKCPACLAPGVDRPPTLDGRDVTTCAEARLNLTMMQQLILAEEDWSSYLVPLPLKVVMRGDVD